MARPKREAVWKNAVQSSDEQFGAKRAALIREAARAFSARGYHDTSLIDVAQELGVTKAALYYYVKSKQDILFECHVISNDLADQASAIALQAKGTGFDRMVLLARTYIDLLVGEAGTLAVLTEFDALEPHNRKVIAARRARFDRTLRELLEEGMKDGSVRRLDPKLTVFFFLGAVNWMTRWFDPGGERTGQQVSDTFVDLLSQGIRAT
ncbi:TetR/AcrR family transcriptional regulator [Sphingomonas sp. CROZ-RG-20F-R02-07]|uniref:TetR/AcrR family transcriptional regulator n=1 Tax=Sphingomonas sp. CROZ-RG-20F-R02-07 TaxID=2914832 RepID=UPI001F5A1A19|nr:TetR/AcrR family transcriptional regulator [Sphingomonas sp. CROZ-RG-20F-R02-07]